jgi:hypothetical protein
VRYLQPAAAKDCSDRPARRIGPIWDRIESAPALSSAASVPRVSRPQFTVRNLLRVGVDRLDRREANAVNRSIVASFVLAVILAVVAYFTMLSTADTETARLLGVVGVIMIATVAISVILNFALMIRERLARWEQRDRG